MESDLSQESTWSASLLRLRGAGRGKGARALTIGSQGSDFATEAGEVDTSGFGTMSFANLECNGNEIEMLYERHNKGHSSLMIGKRRNLLMPVQASSNKPTSLDGADAEEDSDQPRSKRTIYFERGRNGKWGPVAMPAGMTKPQLHRKLVQEQRYVASLSPDQRRVFEEERSTVEGVARAQGLRVAEESGLRRSVAKRRKEKHRAQLRLQARLQAQLAEQGERQALRANNLRARRLRLPTTSRKKGKGQGQAGAAGASVGRRRWEEQEAGERERSAGARGKVRKNAAGGTRRARRPGRHSRRAGSKRR